MDGERDARKEWLRPSEVAPLLGVHRSRVYQLIAAGLLPAVPVGGAIRIPRAAWEQWLASQHAEALARMRVGGGE